MANFLRHFTFWATLLLILATIITIGGSIGINPLYYLLGYFTTWAVMGAILYFAVRKREDKRYFGTIHLVLAALLFSSMAKDHYFATRDSQEVIFALQQTGLQQAGLQDTAENKAAVLEHLKTLSDNAIAQAMVDLSVVETQAMAEFEKVNPTLNNHPLDRFGSFNYATLTTESLQALQNSLQNYQTPIDEMAEIISRAESRWLEEMSNVLEALEDKYGKSTAERMGAKAKEVYQQTLDRNRDLVTIFQRRHTSHLEMVAFYLDNMPIPTGDALDNFLEQDGTLWRKINEDTYQLQRLLGVN